MYGKEFQYKQEQSLLEIEQSNRNARIRAFEEEETNKEISHAINDENQLSKILLIRKYDNDILKYPPKKFADYYFKDQPGYTWEKLRKMFYTGGVSSENTKLKDFLIRNDFTWDQIVTEFGDNKGKSYIHILDFKGTVFINAPTIGLAYKALQDPDFGLNYPPDLGWWFYYTDGIEKPYRVGFAFDYKPSQEQLDEIREDIGTLNYPKRNKTSPDKKKASRNTIYEKVNKEFHSEIQKLANEAWKDNNVPSYLAVNKLAEKYCKKHNIPIERNNQSTYTSVATAIGVSATNITKERIIGKNLDPDNYVRSDSSLNQYRTLYEIFEYQAETKLKQEYEKLTEKYLKKHEAEVKVEFQPYVKLFEEKRKLVLEKLEIRLENVNDTKQIGEWNEAAEQELKLLQKQVMTEASTAFQSSALWLKIDEEIRTELEPFHQQLLTPDIIGYVEKLNDPGLLKIVKGWDKRLIVSRPLKGKNGFYYNSSAEFTTVPQKTEALRSAYWDHIRPYMEKKKYPFETINDVYHLFYYQYSKAFLFTEKGEMTPYALRKWAEEMMFMMVNLSDVVLKGKENLWQIDSGNVYNVALGELREEIGVTVQYLQEIIDYPERSEGILKDLAKGFSSLQTYQYIPFVHSIFDMVKLSKINNVVQKKAAGVPILETELAMIQSYGALMELQRLQPAPFWYNVGKGTAHGLTMIAEFALLSPIGSSGAIIGRQSAFLLLKKYFEKTVVKLIVKGVGKLSSAFFITVANPLRVIEEAQKMGLPMTGVQFNADGSMIILVEPNESANDPMNLFRAFASVYVSNFTELLGGRIFKIIGKGVGKFLPTKNTSSVFSKSLAKTRDLFASKGYHMPLAEYEEEVYDHILQALLRGEAPKFKLEEQLEVFATVMLIGGGAKGLQLTLAGFQYINTFHYEGKEITLSPTVMDALSTLVNSKSREVFDAQLKQLLDTQQISQEEYTLAQKLANEVANFDHHIEVEKESLKQQLMNGSDIDLQVEYAAYQEVYAQLEAIKEQYRLGTAAAEYTLNPSGPNLQLDITISNETELDTWMREMKEAMDFIEGVAEFKNVNIEVDLNKNVIFEESSLNGVSETKSLDDLLKNPDFTSIYDPLVNGNHVQKYAQYNVTIAEESALKLYIQDHYFANFNNALAGDIPMTSEYVALRDLIISAHSKLPKEVKEVYRGTGIKESTFAKSLTKGQQFNFEGRFTSSSTEEYVAELFRRGKGGDIIWQIESKTGIDLKLINASESEILFKPYTQYELIDIIPSSKTPNVFIYQIREL